MTTGMVNQTMMVSGITGNADTMQMGSDNGNFMTTLLSALGGQNAFGDSNLLQSLFSEIGEEGVDQNNNAGKKDTDLTAAMEMMSAMLFGTQNIAEVPPDDLNEMNAQLAAVLANNQNASNIAANEYDTSGQSDSSTQNIFETLLNATSQEKDTTMEVVYRLLQDSNSQETVPKNSAEIFEKAIAEVKGRLGIGEPLQHAEEKPNAEAMQSAVGNGSYLNPVFTKQVAEVQEPRQTTFSQIISQVKTGIVENLNVDKQRELIIKLRPEGLGEVTVKMIENAGKVSLSITTNSQYAQNAISSELNTLREALKPYNAEVSQTVAYDTGSFSQGFGGQASQQQQNRQRYFIDSEETVDDVASKQQYVQALGMALNQYI